MTNFWKASMLAAAVGFTSHEAHAAFTANDLYLGFNQSSGTGDYIIDLGQASAAGVGGSSVVNLSGDFSLSLFNNAFTTGPTGVSMGVVGGQSQFPSSYDLYATVLRSGGPGTASVAGSDLSPFNHSQSTIANSVSPLTGLTLPTAGNGLVDAGKSWTANVSPTFTANSFYGASGVNPSAAFDGTGVLYEDLWKATPNNAYTYAGFFTMDLSGSSPNLTFTPSALAVPEPGSFQLFAVAGLSWLALARRFNRKNK
jgi:hypothetical protein